MLRTSYLDVDRPLRWEWVSFPPTNSGIYVAFIIISRNTIPSVADPSIVGSDLSPTVAWRVPETLQIDGPNLLNNTCGDNQVNIYAANIRLTLLVTIDDIQLHSSCLH